MDCAGGRVTRASVAGGGVGITSRASSGRLIRQRSVARHYLGDPIARGPFLKAAIEVQSNQSTATEAFFQERNRDRLISFLAAIGYREWLIGEKDPRR